MVESHIGRFPLVTPGDVVELEEGMQDLFVMGTVDGFQKVTKIDGLQDMASLTVSTASDVPVPVPVSPRDGRGGGVCCVCFVLTKLCVSLSLFVSVCGCVGGMFYQVV